MADALLGIGLLVALVWLWDIRRALGLRARPHVRPTRPGAAGPRAEFPGAIPPNRYVVVVWPEGRYAYQGCVGATARRVWEHTHPAPGEDVEFWELGDRRGVKAG